MERKYGSPSRAKISATVRRSRASMSSVHIFGAPAEAPRQRLRQRRLAGRHEPDEVDLVRLQERTRHSQSDSSVAKNSG